MSLESKRAMLEAALVAHYAGESHLTGRRVVAALLRTDSARELCARAGMDHGRLVAAVDDPQLGVVPAPQGLVLLPLDSALLPVFGAVIERDGHLSASPLDLLRDILRADAALAELVAPCGLTPELLT